MVRVNVRLSSDYAGAYPNKDLGLPIAIQVNYLGTERGGKFLNDCDQPVQPDLNELTMRDNKNTSSKNKT